MSNKTAEVICFGFIVLKSIAIMAMSVFLSVHTENYHWMWLLSLLFFTDIRVKSTDDDKDEQ